MKHRAFPTRTFHTLAAIAALAWSPMAQAATITDPTGDFLASYAGPRAADLDVVTAGASFNGIAYQFRSTFAGDIGTTLGSVYVWGVDRGAGTPRFAAIAPGVLFDSVVVFTPGVSTVVRDLLTGVATTLASSSTLVSGASLEIDVAAALLPSTGFAPTSYTANLWPRSGNGNNNQISDFAPDNSNLAVTAVPEPVSIAALGVGLLGLAYLRRGRTHLNV